MRILNVVGARPNLMKIAPLVDEMNRHADIQHLLLHTGQHYDEELSGVFFAQLGIPEPDIYLGVGSGSHAEQTARVMVEFEKALAEVQPNAVVTVGDVNSTLACALTAAKLWVPVAHVEAGLRSYDRRMPEEINRIVTDALSDFLFTTSRGANENLRNEGIPPERIFFVGNVMIDTVLTYRDHAQSLGTPGHFDLEPGGYALVTLHRPSNVDTREILSGILDALVAIQRDLPILFPAHPRTVGRMEEFGFDGRIQDASDLLLVEPLGYLEFLDLMMHAAVVLTDSGGIQEETTILGIPCLTLRENTERPITISQGTNTLVGTNPQRIQSAVARVLEGTTKAGRVPELWDGHAARRIVRVLKRELA